MKLSLSCGLLCQEHLFLFSHLPADPLEEIAENSPQTAANSAAELLKQGAGQWTQPCSLCPCTSKLLGRTELHADTSVWTVISCFSMLSEGGFLL